MSLYWNGEPESLHWGGEVSEVYQGSSLVWSAVHPLIRSEPNHWFSLENDAHWYDRGSDDSYLRFPSGSFANRGDFAWSWNAASRLTVPNTWEDGFTLSGWFQITGRYGSTHYFFSRYDTTGARPYIDVWVPGGTGGRDALGIRLGDTAEGATLRTEEGVVPLGEWFHLSIVCENKDPLAIQAYINGQLVHEFDFGSAGYRWPLVFDPASSFSIASYAGSVSPGLMDGNIDDVAIWSRPLSAAEVGSIYRAGPVPTEKLEPAPEYREVVYRMTLASNTRTVEPWVKEVDFLLLGGGGGGDRGNSGNNTGGGGGLAGSWSTGTFVVSGPGQISVEVGRGGSGTTGSEHDHTSGDPTSIFGTTGQLFGSAPGGARGSGSYSIGTSPGTRTYAGMTITGGGTSPVNETGKTPGGGGGGGNGGIFGIFSRGLPGGRGEAYVRFRNSPRP